MCNAVYFNVNNNSNENYDEKFIFIIQYCIIRLMQIIKGTLHCFYKYCLKCSECAH